MNCDVAKIHMQLKIINSWALPEVYFNVLTKFLTRNVNFSEHKKAKPLGIKPKNSQIDKRFKKTVTSAEF